MESGVSIIVGFHSVIFEYIALCRIHISSRRELIFKSFSYICYQNVQEEKAYVYQFLQLMWIGLQYGNETCVMKFKVVTAVTEDYRHYPT